MKWLDIPVEGLARMAEVDLRDLAKILTSLGLNFWSHLLLGELALQGFICEKFNISKLENRRLGYYANQLLNSSYGKPKIDKDSGAFILPNIKSWTKRLSMFNPMLNKKLFEAFPLQVDLKTGLDFLPLNEIEIIASRFDIEMTNFDKKIFKIRLRELKNSKTQILANNDTHPQKVWLKISGNNLKINEIHKLMIEKKANKDSGVVQKWLKVGVNCSLIEIKTSIKNVKDKKIKIPSGIASTAIRHILKGFVPLEIVIRDYYTYYDESYCSLCGENEKMTYAHVMADCKLGRVIREQLEELIFQERNFRLHLEGDKEIFFLTKSKELTKSQEYFKNSIKIALIAKLHRLVHGEFRLFRVTREEDIVNIINQVLEITRIQDASYERQIVCNKIYKNITYLGGSTSAISLRFLGLETEGSREKLLGPASAEWLKEIYENKVNKVPD